MELYISIAAFTNSAVFLQDSELSETPLRFLLRRGLLIACGKEAKFCINIYQHELLKDKGALQTAPLQRTRTNDLS